MNDIELRKYCLDKAVEILGWYNRYLWSHNLNAVRLADLLFRYLKTGEVQDLGRPHRTPKQEQIALAKKIQTPAQKADLPDLPFDKPVTIY